MTRRKPDNVPDKLRNASHKYSRRLGNDFPEATPSMFLGKHGAEEEKEAKDDEMKMHTVTHPIFCKPLNRGKIHWNARVKRISSDRQQLTKLSQDQSLNRNRRQFLPLWRWSSNLNEPGVAAWPTGCRRHSAYPGQRPHEPLLLLLLLLLLRASEVRAREESKKG